MAGTTSQGVIDGIQKLASQLTQLKFQPDASQHMQFLVGLEQALIGYVQSQQQQHAQQATQMGQQAAQAGAMGGPAGPGGGMGGADASGLGMGAGGGGGSPAGSPSAGGNPLVNQMGAGGGQGGMVGLAATPNPDELRRLLQSASAGG